MKKGLCLLNAFIQTDGPTHFYKRMKEELSRLDVSLDLKTNAEILSYIDSDGSIVSNEKPYDFVLYLDKDLYVSFLLEKLGYKLFNSANAIRLCDDKMLTHMALANHGIKMPKTISAPLNYSESISLEFINNVEKKLVYPLVAKDNFGSLGKNFFLIKNHEELLDFEKNHYQNPRLYQEFISSSYGFDYRVIVIGGRMVAAMKRVNKEDWRSNIAQHGKGEKVVLSKEYQKTAEKAAAILGLDYCGIDLLSGKKGEPILCEVNSNAFLGGIEQVSGVNVAKEYAKEIIEKLV